MSPTWVPWSRLAIYVRSFIDHRVKTPVISSGRLLPLFKVGSCMHYTVIEKLLMHDCTILLQESGITRLFPCSPPPVRCILAIGTGGKLFKENNCKHFPSNVGIIDLNTYLLYGYSPEPSSPHLLRPSTSRCGRRPLSCDHVLI